MGDMLSVWRYNVRDDFYINSKTRREILCHHDNDHIIWNERNHKPNYINGKLHIIGWKTTRINNNVRSVVLQQYNIHLWQLPILIKTINHWHICLRLLHCICWWYINCKLIFFSAEMYNKCKISLLISCFLQQNSGNNHDIGTVYVIIDCWHAQQIIIVHAVME